MRKEEDLQASIMFIVCDTHTHTYIDTTGNSSRLSLFVLLLLLWPSIRCAPLREFRILVCVCVRVCSSFSSLLGFSFTISMHYYHNQYISTYTAKRRPHTHPIQAVCLLPWPHSVCILYALASPLITHHHLTLSSSYLHTPLHT